MDLLQNIPVFHHFICIIIYLNNIICQEYTPAKVKRNAKVSWLESIRDVRLRNDKLSTC